MKKFDELSEKITEEEYRNNNRFHYSDISGYMKEGFSYLVKPHKEESESLTFGSMVDCIVTQGMDAFNEKYCVEMEFNLSDNQKTVLNNLLESGFDSLEDIDPDIIIGVLGNYYKNPKSQFTKLIEDGAEYYRFLYKNQGKTPVEFQMFQDAIDVANVLLTNEYTKFLLADDNEGCDRFFQLKFNADYNRLPVTCMVDMIYVDHINKKVYPFDLKTTCANYEWDFPKSFMKYNYWVQAQLYSQILRCVMDNDEDYKDYSLEGFTFIYISRHNKTPLLWTFNDNLVTEDIEIETKTGRKITLEHFSEPLMNMNNEIMCGLKVPTDIRTGSSNDILEYLKKL